MAIVHQHNYEEPCNDRCRLIQTGINRPLTAEEMEMHAARLEADIYTPAERIRVSEIMGIEEAMRQIDGQPRGDKGPWVPMAEALRDLDASKRR